MKKYRWEIEIKHECYYANRVVNMPGSTWDGALNRCAWVQRWPFESEEKALRRAKLKCVQEIRAIRHAKTLAKRLTATLNRKSGT